MDPLAKDIFKKHHGQLRMSEALAEGMSLRSFYSLRDRNIIKPIARGVYRLANLPLLSNPDFVMVALRFPRAIICLVSALDFYGLTTQIPKEVEVAIPAGYRLTTPSYPRIKSYQFSLSSYNAGIDIHNIDGAPVKIFSIEKTIADCFKFRERIGIDIIMESIRLYKARKQINVEKLLEYGRLCRVDKIMKPYFEAIL